MSFGFHPVPKPYREKKPNRKKKKIETFKGVAIPKRRVRGQIDKTNYDKAMDHYNYQCAECGNPAVEMHHIVFRSDLGRKSWRNLVLLCKTHHDACHEKFANRQLKELYSGWFAEKWRELHCEKFGKWYWADRFDLWKAGVIPNSTEEAFEKFMKSEEDHVRTITQQRSN